MGGDEAEFVVGGRVPGFGHGACEPGGGRGTLLMGLVRSAVPGHERFAAAVRRGRGSGPRNRG